MKTTIAAPESGITITPAPNGRVCLTLEARGWTLIDAYLTHEELTNLSGAIVGYALNNAPVSSEFGRGN